MRKACCMCHGTDTQRECEQGQCYAEAQQRWFQDEEMRRYDEERQREEEDQG